VTILLIFFSLWPKKYRALEGHNRKRRRKRVRRKKKL